MASLIKAVSENTSDWLNCLEFLSLFCANVQKYSGLEDGNSTLIDLHKSQSLIENLRSVNSAFEFQKRFLNFFCELHSSFEYSTTHLVDGCKNFSNLHTQAEQIALKSFGIDTQSRLMLSFYSYCCSVMSVVLGKMGKIEDGVELPEPITFGSLSCHEKDIYSKGTAVHDLHSVTNLYLS